MTGIGKKSRKIGIREMSANFRKYIEPLRDREIDAAFIPLDPRQGGILYFRHGLFSGACKAGKSLSDAFLRKPEIIERWLEEHLQSHGIVTGLFVLRKRENCLTNRQRQGKDGKKAMNFKFAHYNYNVKIWNNQ